MLGSFVLAAALSSATLFSTADPLALQVEAPFNDLFDHGRDDKDDKYAVTGSLTFTDEGRRVTMDGVRIMLRGNTSRRENECSFPKLKIDFPEHARPTTPLFAGMSSIKIGTHCGEADNDRLTPKFGRLANEQSPLREAFLYQLLAAVGVPALQARPAKVSYRYTDGKDGESPRQDEPVVRNALVLEGTDEAVRRVGGDRDISEDEFSNAQAQFRTADTARLSFAEAMIGNFDWCLKMTADDAYRCDARHPLWNIVAAELPDGHAIPLLQDFDVSGMVTGSHAWFHDVFSTDFDRSSSERTIEVVAQLQRARSLFTRSVLDAARAEFAARKPKAYEVLAAADLDSDGKKIAREYLDAFYAEIEHDERFYRPVVVRSNVEATGTADGGPVCAQSTVPTGTPVGDPVKTSGGRVQVMLLDAQWRWATSTRCEAMRRRPVWIDAAAIGRDFPAR